MKFFGWMQNKLSGKPAKIVPNAPASSNYPMRKEAVQEEFSDWPHGLLTIGTFGKNEEKEISEVQSVMEQNLPTSPDLSDFTSEEVGKLQEELKKLLSRKSASKNNTNREIMELPLDKFLNKTISVILGKCKEVSVTNRKKNIGKKSMSFLLKKMFVCSNGFVPTPNIRDTLQETRMEKVLAAMIYKTRFPQPSSRTSSETKYLEYDDERLRESGRNKSKWVKTDSEYIVLEI